MGTVMPWSAHSGTLKHVRGNVLTAGEWVKQDPASRRLRCQGHGITAVAVSRRCHEPPLVSEAAWAVRQQHRLAGVRHVRRSQDYIVCMLVGGTGITEPNPYDTTVSKRSWEKSVQRWRHDLKELAETNSPCLHARGGGTRQHARGGGARHAPGSWTRQARGGGTRHALTRDVASQHPRSCLDPR